MSSYYDEYNEENNYDDFMMSDEEDYEMEAIEMEDETDQDSVISQLKGNDDYSSLTPLQELENVFNNATSLKHDNCFNDAIERLLELEKILNNANNLSEDIFEWKYKVRSELIECSFSNLIENGYDLKDTNDVKQYWISLICFIKDNITQFKVTNKNDFLCDLLILITPKIARSFLFESTDHDFKLSFARAELNNSILSILQYEIESNSNMWSKTIQHLVKIRTFSCKIWLEKIKTGHILSYNIPDPDWYFKEVNYSDKYMLEDLDLFLQYLINEYINNGILEPPNKELLNRFLILLGIIKSRSLSVSQRSDLMLLYNFGVILSNISKLVEFEYCEDDIVLTKNEVLQRIQNNSWECLQKLEEIGSNYGNFNSSSFPWFSCFRVCIPQYVIP
ncbi:hypothetical protein Kpol_1020p25 [Vanderwaltozyma polyspora DSM 70294]|uniref:Uncharacterized protein n=1 Tax=Vanderwaltozyma polyspora (strain ATCC 22028 / DSM 70294 / BCRC 21397 / CBS 2163 / NBRC 10782 / NRRL Y-8283 / UCD 57-17) TaxID=436907 RepID=A7TLD6_VANPO|nr:uncharacterized protein Kpol_1020p25 [Vanderwaltozyma polyspora DSM 70294]EDO16917.1 hypothetical protein Kpol_1020p25 [Vanderwaltozyma polyspora DSM 70294]